MSEWKLDKQTCQEWQLKLNSIKELMLHFDNLKEKTDFKDVRDAQARLKTTLYLPVNINQQFFQKLVFTSSGKKYKGANGLDIYVSIATSIKIMDKTLKIGDEFEIGGSLHFPTGSINLSKMKTKIVGITVITGDIIIEARGRLKKVYITITQSELENKLRKNKYMKD